MLKLVNDSLGNQTSEGNWVEYENYPTETIRAFGPYKMELKVDIEFTKPDTDANNPQWSEWTTWAKKQGVKVTATGTRLDNDSLKYLWTTSASEPMDDTAFTKFTNGSTFVKENETGIYYLWVSASDKSGV